MEKLYYIYKNVFNIRRVIWSKDIKVYTYVQIRMRNKFIAKDVLSYLENICFIILYNTCV